jgi:hypothetical protein
VTKSEYKEAKKQKRVGNGITALDAAANYSCFSNPPFGRRIRVLQQAMADAGVSPVMLRGRLTS